MNTFSIRETLRFAWTAFRKYPWAHISIAFIFIITAIVSGSKSAIIGLLGSIAMFIFKVGYIDVVLKSLEGEKPRLNLFERGWMHKDKFWRFFLGSAIILLMAYAPFVITLLVFLGFIGASAFGPDSIAALFTSTTALILIAFFLLSTIILFYVTIRYAFFGFVLIDRNLSVKQSLKESAKLMKGHGWKYLSFLAVLGLILLIPAITIIGILLVIPFSALAQGYVYRKLEGRTPTLGTALEIPPEMHPVAEAQPQ